MKKISLEFKKIPKQDYFLNGVKYTGRIAFINGFNGYTRTENDGFMCALINHSCFTDGEPNILLDTKGNAYHATNKCSNTEYKV